MNISQCSREFQLLVACSWLPGPDRDLTSESLGRLCADPFDWGAFLSLVRRHQVQGVAQAALGRADAGVVHPNAASELKHLAGAASRKSLRSAAELVRLRNAFEAHSIPVVSLKGVILSWQLYGDPGTRSAGDLDVMIRPEDLVSADALLGRLGYTCSVLPGVLKLLRTHGYECSYRDENTGLTIDVHWAHELWTARQTSELWEHCDTAELGGARIRHLTGDALLLFLCDHGTKHRWSLIKWLGDVAMLLAAPRAAPWSTLFALAARWDLVQPLAEAALLVHWLYGIDVPPSMPGNFAEAARHASESIAAIRMTREQLILADSQAGSFCKLRFSARRRKGLSWWAHLRRLMIQVEDLQLFPLPGGLAWCHYPLRPWLWCWRRYGRHLE